MRQCRKCNQLKGESDFNFKVKSTNKLSPYCKECSRNYIRDHYLKNREYYLLKAKTRSAVLRKEVRDYLTEYLKTHPCVDCGENNIIVLEFDHVKDKLFAISKLSRNGNFAKLTDEIAKCEVRCANCHRIKTAKQFGWYKDELPL